jgi:hypothetical protein
MAAVPSDFQRAMHAIEALVRELMQDIDICEPNSPFVAAVNAAVDQIEAAIHALGARCPRTLRCSVLALASRISTHEMPWAADPFVAAADTLVAALHHEPASEYEATLWRVAALAGNITPDIYPGAWAAGASFAAVDRIEALVADRVPSQLASVLARVTAADTDPDGDVNAELVREGNAVLRGIAAATIAIDDDIADGGMATALASLSRADSAADPATDPATDEMLAGIRCAAMLITAGRRWDPTGPTVAWLARAGVATVSRAANRQGSRRSTRVYCGVCRLASDMLIDLICRIERPLAVTVLPPIVL